MNLNIKSIKTLHMDNNLTAGIRRINRWWQASLMVALLFCSGISWGQGPIASWEFTGVSGYGLSPMAPTTSNSNLTIVGLTRGGGITTTPTAASNAWGGNGLTEADLASAIANEDYVTFEIEANSGYQVSLSSISAYNVRRSSSGATTGQWQYQINSGSYVDIGGPITWGGNTSGPGNSQAAIDLSTISALQNVSSGDNITFRLVIFGASGATGTWYLNQFSASHDFIINGTVAAIPAPVINSPLTLNGTYNTPLTYTITATNTPTSYGAAPLPAGLGLSGAVIAGTPTAVGVTNTTISATNAGGTANETLVITIDQAPQSITFSPLTPVNMGDADFQLGAVASSGLAVSYSSSNPLVATVSGDMVTIVGPGTTDITASQAGDANYLAATPVMQTLTVNPQTAFYVNDNSTAGDVFTAAIGNDANPGTASAPFATIAHAISVASAGHTIWVDAGTYNEVVALNKSLTITGAGGAATIITPAVPCVASNGITITADGSTVKDLRVTGYNYGFVVNADNISLDGIESVANCGATAGTGTGIEMANGVSGLSIKNSKLNNNVSLGLRAGTAAQITGVTVEDTEIKGNSQGVYIAAVQTGAAGNTFDNVLFKNVDASDNDIKGMYFEKLSNATFDNVVMNNSGKNATYGFNAGIDINLKNGAYSNITLRNSTITNSGLMGGATNVENPVAVTIKARDDGSYATWPATLSGVLVENNIISGGVNALRFNESGKVPATPTGVVVVNNFLQASNKTIINAAPASVTASCNWFSKLGADVAASTSGNVISSPYLLDGTDGSAAPGFQPSAACATASDFYVNDNSLSGDVYTTAVGDDNNAGSASAPFATLQKALAVAGEGNNIWVDAGTYTPSSLVINKGVQIKGANAASSPVTGYVNAESVLDFTANMPSTGGNHINITSATAVTLQGFRIVDNDFPASAVIRHAVNLHTSFGHVIQNNLFFRNSGTTGGGQGGSDYRAIYVNFPTAATTLTIDNNYFTGSSTGIFGNQSWRRGIWKQGGTGTVNITNNKFDFLRSHLNLEDNVATTVVTGNTFDLGSTGIGAVALGGAPVLTGTFAMPGNNFIGHGTFVNLSTVDPSFVADLTGASFNGVAAGSLTLQELFDVDARVHHGAGLVRVKAGNVYTVTTGFTPSGKGNIQTMINKASVGDVVNIADGTYNGDIVVNKAVTLDGQSQAAIIRGAFTGQRTVTVTAADVTIKDVTVTRDYGDWYSSPKTEGIIVENVDRLTIDNVLVKDNRNGIYIHNCQDFVVKNSTIDANRTGFQIWGNLNGGEISNNFITNNHTHGLLVNFDQGATSGVGLKINNNNISGNWYSQISFQRAGATPAANVGDFTGFDATCNWYGTMAPAYSATATTEPGYAALVPSQLGGTDPGVNADIKGVEAALITYTPFLWSGADSDAAAGFQPTPGSCGSVPTDLYVNDGSTTGDLITGATGSDANAGTAASPFATIQHAINVAPAGATIHVDAGTYAENVLVNKTLTIQGADKNVVIVHPATNGYFCGTPSSVCAGSVNVFTVRAHDVMITGVTVDGDNPLIGGGFASNGADINARNGIITDHGAGTWNNMQIVGNIIKNIYLRGIYASSSGSFTITGNTVENVKGEAASIAIMQWAGTGTIANNTINDVNDGIAANHSKGAVYYGNTVTNAGSGIHTDNNGSSGGVADHIYENTVSNGKTNSYGIFVFAPYRAVTVERNTINNVDVGFANTGHYADVTVTFNANTIDGMGRAGSTGIYQTTEIWGYDNKDVKGVYNNNFVRNVADAFYIDHLTTATNYMTFNNNSVSGHTNGVVTAPTATGTFVQDFTCNWWGTAASGAAIAAAVGPTPGINYMPYLNNGTDDSPATGFQPVAGACTLGPVHNITQDLYYTTIQPAVNAANPGDVIELDAYEFNEKVVITKSLTLQGVDSATSIIDGTGLGNGSGILINTGVTNVTIKDLTVRNHSGASGNAHAGIYANAGNHGLVVSGVKVHNNTNSSGIYANGPVNGVTITNNTVFNHLSGARGIVIWNGLKENITITGNHVFNNNCCGIELSDGKGSNVNVSNNNVHDNGDNGIGLIGLGGTAGPNVVANNTLTNNGRFGIEIKLPEGTGSTSGAGSIVVDGNTVSQTASFASLRPSEVRDLGGIVVIRRGLVVSEGNADIPTGVVVSNNTVSGYVQDNGSSSSTGFGIVVEGTNHTVTGNNLTGNDVGLQLQAGHQPYVSNTNTDGNQANLNDLYFGRGNSPVVCGVTVSGNTFGSNGTDERMVTGGGAGTIVTLTTAPIAITETHTPINCFGETSTITADATGGTDGKMYSLNGGTPQSSNEFVVSAGTYTIVVTDAAGCSASVTTTITEPAQLATPTATVTQPTCSSLGTIVVNTPAPAAGIAYSIDGVDYTNTDGIFTIPAAGGTFNVTYQTGGCTSPALVAMVDVQVATPATPGITIVNNGNYTFTLTATGYTESLLWSTGETTPSIIVPSSATPYTLVQFNSACTSAVATAVVSINDPAVGGMDITNAGDVSQNSNTLAFGQVYKLKLPVYNLSQLNGIPDGTTTVTIDLGSRMILDPAFDLSTAPLSAYFDWSVATVGGNQVITGTQTAIIPADFADVAVFNVRGSLTCTSMISAGISSTTVDEDLNNNNATLQYTFPATVSAVPTNVTCNGASNGGITVTASPGTTISITNSSNVVVSTTAVTTGLPAGVYTVTVSATGDAPANNICTVSTTVTINQPAALVAGTTGTNVTCFGGNNGSATVTVTGGTPNYSYSWNTVPAQFTPTATGLPAGTYTVTITDANGCSTTANYTVTQPGILSTSLTGTAVSCHNGNNGTVTVTSVSGGTGPYSFTIAGPTVNTTGAVSGAFTGLTSGLYTVTTTDANGCTNSVSYVVNQPASAVSLALNSVTGNACNGGTNGTISVTASGGNPGYTYTIAGPTVNTTGAVSGNFTGLAGGNYVVTVTDASGCTASVNATVTQPSGTNPDLSLGSDYSSNFFMTNGAENTIIFNVSEIGGNPAVGDTIRITKVAGYNITFDNTITTANLGFIPYSVDNAQWKVDNSSPAFMSLIKIDPTLPGGPGTIGCGQLVRVAVKIKRNTPNLSTFTLSSRLRQANGEVNLSNNLNSIVFTAE